MKKLPLLICIVILISGCSKGKLIKSAENYLLTHIGESKSYERIEWKITDTTFLNDLKVINISNTIRKEGEILYGLERLYEKNNTELDKMRRTRLPDSSPLKLWIFKYLGDEVKRDPFTGEWITIPFQKVLGEHLQDSTDYLNTILKYQAKLDSLEKVRNNLKETRKKSPIKIISMYVRFRAKMANLPIFTYKANLEYDYDLKTVNVGDIEFDGVENQINR